MKKRSKLIAFVRDNNANNSYVRENNIGTIVNNKLLVNIEAIVIYDIQTVVIQ